MSIMNRQTAEELLREAEKRNPGLWVNHSLYTAKAAEAIAKEHPELDAEKAYVLGCLHDIGRIEGITKLHHIVAGYNLMKEKGYEECARICLTHSFPVGDIREFLGKFDCTEGEIEFIRCYLRETEYNDYDRLIQLSDFLAGPDGFCIIEKRIIDEAIIKGTNELSVTKWKKVLEIKKEFEIIIKQSIYSVLPGVEDSIKMKVQQ